MPEPRQQRPVHVSAAQDGSPDPGKPIVGASGSPAPPSEHPPAARPDYKLYRSSGGVLSKLRLRDRLRLPRRGRGDRDGGWTPKRVLKIVLAVLAVWVLISIATFLVSAQTSRGVSDRTEEVLGRGANGDMLTGATILVLGSDEREQRIREQLAERGEDPGEGGRADSILLLHVGFGTVRRLSILRDSQAEIPGEGTQRINAAYFFGGPPLMIRTVERFMGNGLQIDHLIEVNFRRFPELIDALGGVDVTVDREICAPGFDGAAEGVNLEPGEHHLDGEQALNFARVRKNPCTPEEDDRARAARQQQVLSAIRSQALSPTTFVRLPWVSWQAPRAIRSDLRGPGLSALFLDLLTGGTGKTSVLEPASINSDGSLAISEAERDEAVARLLGEG